jgi:predicted nucleic acid-binding protein
MRLVDVNVLVYAHRLDSARHQEYADWTRNLLADQEPYGVADIVLSGFLRVVTHPKVFRQPTPLETALAFVEVLRYSAQLRAGRPGPAPLGDLHRPVPGGWRQAASPGCAGAILSTTRWCGHARLP